MVEHGGTMVNLWILRKEARRCLAPSPSHAHSGFARMHFPMHTRVSHILYAHPHISHRSRPCLVAHNGAMFDFVILREEARRSLVQLPTGWAILDTLRMAQVGAAGDGCDLCEA